MARADLPSSPQAWRRGDDMLPTTEESQAQLLRRIAAEDREALGEFYDQVARPLFSVAVRMLGNPQEAEEVIQDVFVQIWNKAQMFNAEIGQPFHWTLGILRNRCIDRLRARQRRAKVIVELEEGQEFNAAAEAVPVAKSLGQDELSAIRSAVEKLPGDQRQAIELAFFGGLTHPEIADELQEPLGTVKARIRRGMLKLRDTLQDYL